MTSSLAAVVAHQGGHLVATGHTSGGGGAVDALALGMDPLGNQVWDRTIELGGKEQGRAVAVDTQGRVGVVGTADAWGLVSVLDPWGRASCAESGGCAIQKLSKCDDGKPCTRDVCTAKHARCCSAAPRWSR